MPRIMSSRWAQVEAGLDPAEAGGLKTARYIPSPRVSGAGRAGLRDDPGDPHADRARPRGVAPIFEPVAAAAIVPRVAHVFPCIAAILGSRVFAPVTPIFAVVAHVLAPVARAPCRSGPASAP